MTYSLEKLKEAIKFNSAEVLPALDSDNLDQELTVLIEKANESGQPLRHYIGFEVSGLIHIGTGMATALKVKKLTDAGVVCSLWLADYHTYLNNKLDGTYESIRFVAREYFEPVMLKCLEIAGCNMDLVEVLHAQDTYAETRDGISFWEHDMACGKELTLSRVLKSVSITGKEAGNSVDFGTLRYPVMQVADAYFMQTHFVHAGLDQRKCHVLMREIADKLDDKYAITIGGDRVKPIAIHHDLLLSLEPPKEGENSEGAKMSKSKPDSAVWVHDTFDEINRKLRKAYCPMPDGLDDGQLERIPLLQWSRYMIYPAGKTVSLVRPEKFGGNKAYATYQDLFDDYKAGNIHPLDLKSGVARCLADWFAPIREWVENNPDGYNKVKEIKGL